MPRSEPEQFYNLAATSFLPAPWCVVTQRRRSARRDHGEPESRDRLLHTQVVGQQAAEISTQGYGGGDMDGIQRAHGRRLQDSGCTANLRSQFEF